MSGIGSIPTSQESFAIVARLIPHALAALVPVSLKLLLDAQTMPSSLHLDEIVTNDITKVVALAEDQAFISGSGSGQPLGILNTAGTTAGPSTGTNGSTPSLSLLKAIPAGCAP